MSLREEALATYRHLDGLRIEAVARIDAPLAIHAAHAALNAWERYQRRLTKCDQCGEQLTEGEHTLCSLCFRVYECW